MGFSDLPPDPPTDLQGPPLPALVSGTSREFLGRKPLPRAIRDRAMVFLLGPLGVGKTTVARFLAGEHGHYLSEADVLKCLKDHARVRSWKSELVTARALVLECPCFMNRRPAAMSAIQELLRSRAGGGRSTWVVEAESGTAMERVMSVVHPGYRATVVLRFPVGRGRLRYAKTVCDDLGIAASLAASTMDLSPWTYAAVRGALSEHVGPEAG